MRETEENMCDEFNIKAMWQHSWSNIWLVWWIY